MLCHRGQHTPLLFSHLHEKTGEVNRELGLYHHPYADNMLFHLRLSSNPTKAVKELGHGLKKVRNSMRENKWKRHSAKKEVLLAGPDSTLDGEWDLESVWGSSPLEGSGPQLGSPTGSGLATR